MRRVAVTGGSGFVGRWLLRHLAERGVDAADFFPENGGRLTDEDFVRDRLRRLQPDSVVHLAAVAAPSEARRDARRAFEVNVTGTLILAEAILRDAPRTRLVYASSSEVYGKSFNRFAGPLAEDTPLEPGSLYGVTKASADLLLGQMAAEGLDVVRFRPFNHTGPGQTDAYVAPAFARQVARIERGLQASIIDVGNLEAKRDFLDVRDVVRAYAQAALAHDPLPEGVALNLASGIPRKISSVLDALIAMSAVEIGVRQDPTRMRPSETAHAAGDASLAHRLLGWAPEIPFETTLRDVLDHWRYAVSPAIGGTSEPSKHY